ncbi:MAG TPA: sterol desaturase family protein [Rhodanobacteraceae bacterium]|nr:sterol desaturase family protein [Rhodanobacteraceae bacterium]
MSDTPKATAPLAASDVSGSHLPAPLRWIARPLARLSVSHFNLRAGLTSDCLISVLLIAAGIWYGHMHMLPAGVTVLCGLFAFTFLEYSAHRWLFHGNTGPFRAGHDHHHDDPLGYDALPFFMPPLFMATLGGLFALAIPAGYALLLAGTIAAGYAAYGLSHVVIHVHRFKSATMRRWVGFHNIHHYHPDANFGVTTGLWDVILGTRYQRAPRPAIHHR